MDSEQIQQTRELRESWLELVNDKSLADVRIILEERPLEFLKYLSLRTDLRQAENHLQQLNILEKPYEYLKLLNIRDKIKQSLKQTEELLRSQQSSYIQIIDQYKNRLTRDKLGGMAEIARDYLQARQQQEKLKYPTEGQYIWRTQGDDQVRADHAAREGRIYSFTKPPLGGHPGQFYNCRCWAEYLPAYWEAPLGDLFKN